MKLITIFLPSLVQKLQVSQFFGDASLPSAPCLQYVSV